MKVEEAFEALANRLKKRGRTGQFDCSEFDLAVETAIDIVAEEIEKLAKEIRDGE